ncbi:MAG: peptidoglycan-binding domain-containing protein [Pseudomonadota bacterium]|jgi:hypothetical protein|nr:peptidoglycan-binding domain-containing protein [Pseudomonadota bacterium]
MSLHDRRLSGALLATLALGACASDRYLSEDSAYLRESTIPPPYVTTARTAQPPPNPAFEFENRRSEILDTPTFRKQTNAEIEQQRTAERLAMYQRSAALDGGGYVNAAASTGGYSSWNTVATSTDASNFSSWQTVDSGVLYSNASVEPTRYVETSVTPYTDASMVAPSPSIPPMPAARAGECYALVRTPERYETVTRDYVSQPAYERYEVIPPQYTTGTRSFTTQEAYERLEVVPATFKTVTEQVLVRPASTRYVTTEPVYETQNERIMIAPARQVWKPGRGPIERQDYGTGQIYCLVEEPAQYSTVTRRVMRRTPEVRQVEIPAEYRTVTRRVIDRPAQVRRVAVAPQTSQMTVQELSSPGQVRRVQVPQQTSSVPVKQLVSASQLEWRPVLCETNMSPGTIQRLQRALKSAGHDPGPIDGKVGPRTMAAVNAYQRSRKLPVDAYLNLDTLRALGVAN